MSEMSTRFFFLKGKTTKETFLRNAYIALYSAQDAPPDVDEIVLSEVQEMPIVLLRQHNRFDINYKLEIGYRRDEQYIAEESYYDSSVGKRVSRPVVKTRQRTDWQPYQSEQSGVRIPSYHIVDRDSLKDGEGRDIENGRLTSLQKAMFSSAWAEQLIANGQASEAATDENVQFYPLSEQEQKLLAKLCANEHNFYMAVLNELPGEAWRNFHANWSITDMDTDLFLAKQYVAVFDYKGLKGLVHQHEADTEQAWITACPYVDEDTTADDLEQEKTKTLDADEKINVLQQCKKFAQYGAYGLSILLLLIGLIFSNSLGVTGLVLWFYAAVIAIVAYLAIKFLIDKPMQARKQSICNQYDQKIQQHHAKKQANQITRLNARFEKLNMEPLTQQEVARFSEKEPHYFGAKAHQ